MNLNQLENLQKLISDRVSLQKTLEQKKTAFEASIQDLINKLAEIDKQLAGMGVNLGEPQSSGPKKKTSLLIMEALQKAGKMGLTVPQISAKTGIKAQNVSAWLFINVKKKKNPNIKKIDFHYVWNDSK